MKIPKNANKRQFTLEGVQATIPAPFAEGHVCTEGEASSLNQTLVENVRNNLASKVKALEDKTPEAVQSLVDAYVTDYEFGVRSGGGRVVDPVQALALELARDIVKKQIRESGGKLNEVSRKEITERAEKLVEKNPKIVEVAKANIEQQSALAGIK